MNQLMFFAASWILLAGIVAALAMYRKMISMHEDDSLHLGEFDEPLSVRQQALSRELHWIDRWGKILTVTALAYGAGLACLFLYRVWAQGGALTPQ